MSCFEGQPVWSESDDGGAGSRAAKPEGRDGAQAMNRKRQRPPSVLLGLAVLGLVAPGSGEDELPHAARWKVRARSELRQAEGNTGQWSANAILASTRDAAHLSDARPGVSRNVTHGMGPARSIASEPVTITLGTSGASITLEMTADGSYKVTSHEGVASYTSAADGIPVRVTARDGKTYVLSKDASGMWMATFASDPVTVTLGTSGTTVQVAKVEDGSYLVDGTVLEEGDTVLASNGATYALTRNDAGEWMATFVPPSTTVRLGASSDSVTISTTEDGRYKLTASGGFANYKSTGDGTPVRVTVRNGNTYSLSKSARGEWIATFVPPDPVPVRLGASGTSIEVQRAEDGSWSVGGELLKDGREVVAGNGSVYALVIDEEGRWTAVFVPPQTSVRLGSSGESVIVETTEDGRFSIGGSRFEDGMTVTTAKGSRYTLTLGDGGNWIAVFQVPDPVSVELGASGTIVEIRRAEDGTYAIGDQVLSEGYTHRAANGENYTLSMDADGMWVATHKGVETPVDLGASGESVTLVRGEDGRYSRDGSTVESGDVVMAANGSTYRLALEPDGKWRASYVPRSQRVSLGVSGSLTLTRAEDGSWSDGQQQVQSGETVAAQNGVMYRLTLADGEWSASFEAVEKRIAGTNLVAVSREDGRGYRVGSEATLPETGTGDVSVAGAMYHVWMEGEDLNGVRFDRGPYGTNERAGNFQLGLASGLATLRGDDPETVANEAGTTLKVGGQEFPIAALLESGSVTVAGKTITAEALDEITSLRRQVQLLVEVFEADRTALEPHLNSKWEQAQEAVDKIFGPGKVTLHKELSPDAVVGAIDELIAALSSRTAFQAATARGLGGVFDMAALSTAGADEVYLASAWEAMAGFGRTGDTRYGAIWSKVRENGNAVDALALGVDGAELGAFAYSTIRNTAWTRDIANGGSAHYAGGTVAVSGDGTIYAGDIELVVQFPSNTISAVVSNLGDSAGDPWKHLNANVGSIILPDAQLKATADWSFQVRASDMASVRYSGFRGRPGSLESTFAGHLLGVGDQAGSQAVGVWSIGKETTTSGYLAGGFGAELVIEQQEVPLVSDGGVGTGATVVPVGTELGNGTLTLRGTRFGPDLSTPGLPDDEIQVLVDGSAVEDLFRVPLGGLFRRQGSEWTYSGERHVDVAREEISRLRDQLILWVRLDDASVLDNRQTIWDAINRVIQARLFGTERTSPYPVRDGYANDARAFQLIDAVLAALDSRSALELALGGGGVFTDADDNPIRDTPVGDIWNRAESRVRLWLGSTDYTRFGVWRKQTSANASAGYSDRLEDNENGPNSFAYSSLRQTAFSSERDANYPGGVTAKYSGETVAVQGTTFYTGSVELEAQWHASWLGPDSNQAGILSAVFRDLRNELGDALTYTVTDAGRVEVGAIRAMILPEITIRVAGDGAVYFANDDVSDARLRFVDSSRSDSELDSVAVDGKFVGQGVGGPPGVIGTWTSTDAGDTRLGSGDTLYGAFGAELGP